MTRFLLPLFVFLAIGLCSLRSSAAATPPPNIVIIFMDDMGYADVGCFGAKAYQTPNIDRLAKQGRRFTNFHVAQPVCSASRAALLTGCYPNRIGIHGALGPKATHGIADEELTLAEVVKQKGYATAIVGKWHLGQLPRFLPSRHGFDEYYGLPYSNDMWPHHPNAAADYPRLTMIENDRVIDPDVTAEDQTRLTADYTSRAVSFIARHRDKPFLLYLAHSMVHVPLFAGERFKGKSGKGLFADVMMEVDWSVGEVLKALDDHGLQRNTWVIFTSDNGPWLSYGEHAGSAGMYREGKGTCWEGGTRVPCIMRWPGKLAPGTSSDAMLMTIDLLPTIAARLGATLPDHPIDGKDVWPLLAGEKGARNPHDFYAFYYGRNEFQALTSGDGRWKLQLPHTYTTIGDQPKATGGKPVKYQRVQITQPELYDLQSDPGERKDLATERPEILAKLQNHAAAIRADLGDALQKQEGQGTRKPGGN